MSIAFVEIRELARAMCHYVEVKWNDRTSKTTMVWPRHKRIVKFLELGKYKKYAMDRKALRGSDDKRKRSNQISRKKK